MKKFKLQSLRALRIKYQLTIMFKIKNKYVDLRFDRFFQDNKYKKTRGNAFKLLLQKSRTKPRQNYFSCFIIKHWNMLRTSDINVRSICLFKKKVDAYLKKAMIY